MEVSVPDYDKQLWFDGLLDKVKAAREVQSVGGEGVVGDDAIRVG
jgi:hypothetical protein